MGTDKTHAQKVQAHPTWAYLRWHTNVAFSNTARAHNRSACLANATCSSNSVGTANLAASFVAARGLGLSTTVGLYGDCVALQIRGMRDDEVVTACCRLQRHLSAAGWKYSQRGQLSILQRKKYRFL